jgi:hypothetical protein
MGLVIIGLALALAAPVVSAEAAGGPDHDTDEDSWIINVAAGTKYKNGRTNYSGFQVYARLGGGVFCAEDADKNYADLNSVQTVYRKGSTWRAVCNPNDDRNTATIGY